MVTSVPPWVSLFTDEVSCTWKPIASSQHSITGVQSKNAGFPGGDDNDDDNKGSENSLSLQGMGWLLEMFLGSEYLLIKAKHL